MLGKIHIEAHGGDVSIRVSLNPQEKFLYSSVLWIAPHVWCGDHEWLTWSAVILATYY